MKDTLTKVLAFVVWVLIVVFAGLFVLSLPSCTRTVYVDKDSEYFLLKNLSTTEFFDKEALVDHPIDEDAIFVDKKTDVLYYQWNYRCITPIMKADGTCLTYSEWKANRK